MKKILFICGSLNQTTQMHKISQHLDADHECYFTPYYADGIVNLVSKLGWLDFTVLGGRHHYETDEYLKKHNLPIDLRGEKYNYDLVVSCSDLIVQKNIRKKRLILVQEGITEPEGFVYKLVRWLKLPRYLANTSTSGLSDAYDIFCVASEGYAEHFIRKGCALKRSPSPEFPTSIICRNSIKMIFPFIVMYWWQLLHYAKHSVLTIERHLFKNA